MGGMMGKKQGRRSEEEKFAKKTWEEKPSLSPGGHSQLPDTGPLRGRPIHLLSLTTVGLITFLSFLEAQFLETFLLVAAAILSRAGLDWKQSDVFEYRAVISIL
jgi:hypothetical protein